MSAPMLLDDEVVGVLSLWRTEVDPFDERAIALLEAFAAQAAIVVRNVDLVRALEARGVELARKVEQLEALSEVGEVVSSSLDLDEVLSTIVTNAVRLTGTDGGSIMEYVEEERQLLRAQRLRQQRRAPAEAPRDPDRAARPRWSAGPRSRATRSRSPTSTRSPRPAPAAPARRRVAVGARRPRCSAGRIVGALVVRRKTAGRLLRRRRSSCCETFASQSALAMSTPGCSASSSSKTAELRGRQPAQVGVPRQHVARAAHAAERGDRVLRGAAGADVRRAQRPPGRVPPRHPAARAGTCSSCSTRSSTSPRSRPARWSSSRRRSRSARRSSTASPWSASARHARHHAHPRRRSGGRRDRRRRAAVQAGACSTC